MKAAFVAIVAVALALFYISRTPASQTDPLIARGRYLVAFGGCNDCHTPGWKETDGRIPVSQWMTGGRVGYRGPWGTVYPVNVRRWFQTITEDQWVFSVRTRGGRPPMQWHDIRFLDTQDQRAIYRFIHSLGTAGGPAPDDVPPWETPKTPYVNVIPQTPQP